jgi:hypothetical protein
LNLCDFESFDGVPKLEPDLSRLLGWCFAGLRGFLQDRIPAIADNRGAQEHHAPDFLGSCRQSIAFPNTPLPTFRIEQIPVHDVFRARKQWSRDLLRLADDRHPTSFYPRAGKLPRPFLP